MKQAVSPALYRLGPPVQKKSILQVTPLGLLNGLSVAQYQIGSNLPLSHRQSSVAEQKPYSEAVHIVMLNFAGCSAAMSVVSHVVAYVTEPTA